MPARLKPEVLKNWPPGGWRFLQPQTGWAIPNPLEITFEQAQDVIIQHRKANPRFNLPTDRTRVGYELQEYTAQRLNNDPKFVLVAAYEPKKKITTQDKPSWLRKAADYVDVPDTDVLREWLGEGGKPVPPELSSQRAAICASCPENDKLGTWVNLATGIAGRMLRRALELKHDRKIRTPSDKEIGMCNVCKCWLALKVHTPLEVILENEEEETLAKYPQNCWIASQDF